MKEKRFKELTEEEEEKGGLIGTAEYISPEMINEGKCGVAGDLWALGCMLYQFFHGTTPFQAQTQHLVLQNIVDKKMAEISPTLNENAKDLISKLLDYDPQRRIGAGEKKF